MKMHKIPRFCSERKRGSSIELVGLHSKGAKKRRGAPKETEKTETRREKASFWKSKE